jgi:hypothetical protein
MTPSVSPLPAAKALDAYFLEARSKLLDVAAILDRVGRGPEADAVRNDPRMAKVYVALDALRQLDGARAERIQQIFSRPYDADWERPTPR